MPAITAEDIYRSHKARGLSTWLPACGMTETPMTTRSGARVLYCFQPLTGRHAYIDLGTDLQIPDENLKSYGLGA